MRASVTESLFQISSSQYSVCTIDPSGSASIIAGLSWEAVQQKSEQEALYTMSESNVIANQKTIIANQSAIRANQKAIQSNQGSILKNQAGILKNQGALTAILKNQKEILTLLKK
jgi:ribonucleotide monophosphatase NagD (HAD superfamily)